MSRLAMDQFTTPSDPISGAPAEPLQGRPLRLGYLSGLALFVGVITGFGAVVFRGLIGLIHNIFFLGSVSFAYNAAQFTPAGHWGVWVILVPVIGGLGVTFLVSNFAPEAKGHGVPEVMDAIYYKGGKIRPVVAVVKSLASALSIGSGAAVGREGPIIQIGSALGSTLGQMIKMPAASRIILVAAGAGAGIAATFNTPIGGMMFAIELMLPEVSVTSFLPVALATGAATFVGRYFFGSAAAFVVPPLGSTNADPQAAASLLLFVVLGALTGAASALFVRGLHWVEDWFEIIPGRYTRHIAGMVLVGVLIYAMQIRLGHYYVEGVGYAGIEQILNGQLSLWPVLALLFIAKLAATTTSLGSGASGGIFSPSLFMGATIGGAFAALLQAVHLPLPVSVPVFAMVGMAAMVGGGTGAVMTAVTMIFEMTRDYNIVMPMIVAVAVSVQIRQMLSPETMYTLKLVRRGHPIPKALHANMFMVKRAAEVMNTAVTVLPAEISLDAFLQNLADDETVQHVVVTENGLIAGVMRLNPGMRRGLAQTDTGLTLGDASGLKFTIVRDNTMVFDVIRRIWDTDAVLAVVVGGRGAPRGADVLGLIGKEQVADSVAASVLNYPE
ncbi:MAG: chloride channel protein [Acidocella sp.]|nr:chloride channel protein [Acidocella sp.]